MIPLLPDLSCEGTQAERTARFDRWQAHMPLDSYRQHHSSDSLRVHMVLNHLPPTDAYLRRTILFLGPLGVCPAELAGVSTMPSTLRLETVARAAKLGQHIYRPARPTGGLLVTKAQLAKSMAKALRSLPETMLDPEHGDEFGEIDQRHGARLALFEPQGMRVAVACAYVIEHSYRPASNMAPFLSAQERVGDCFAATGEDFQEPLGVERVIREYMSGRLFPTDGPVARKEVIRVLLSLPSLLDAYVLDNPETAEALDRVRPARLPVGSPLADAFRQHAAEIDADCDANRKRLSDPLADEFDRRHADAHIRMVEAWTMHFHARLAEKALNARRPDGTFVLADDDLGFSYRSRTVLPNGRRTMSMQRTFMTAHRRQSFFPDRPTSDVVFAFVRVEGEDAPPQEPWFITTFRDGALLPPVLLDIERRERRRATIIRLGLPEYARRPSAVAGFAGRADAEDAADALGRGIVLVPIHAFAHAMLLAHLLFRIMAYTFCRVGEALQMVFPPAPDGWQEVFAAGRWFHAFAAIPKGWTDPDWLLVDERTLKFILMLMKLAIFRSPEGKVVLAKPTTALKDKVPAAAKFVLSFGGHHFGSDELNFMFQHLTAGLALQLRS